MKHESFRSLRRSSVRLASYAAAFAAVMVMALAGAQEDTSAKSKTEPRKGPRQPADPQLSPDDMKQITDILAKLQQAFLKGNTQQVMNLFGPKHAEINTTDERLKAIRASLDQEFQNEHYHSFDILDDPMPDDKLSGRRHSVWVQLRYSISEKVSEEPDSKAEKQFVRETNQNNIFIFQKNRQGQFLLADSPFFDTIGKRRPFSDTLGRRNQFIQKFAPNILLGFTCLLAVMGFWVWMGFLAFRMRPRNYFWRFFIMLPVLGAAGYFLIVYLPGWWRGSDMDFADYEN